MALAGFVGLVILEALKVDEALEVYGLDLVGCDVVDCDTAVVVTTFEVGALVSVFVVETTFDVPPIKRSAKAVIWNFI